MSSLSQVIFVCICLISISGNHCATISPPLIETLDSADKGPEFIPLPEDDKPKFNINAVSEDAEFWRQIGLKQLGKIVKQAQKQKDNSYQKKAKNVIIFVGDGMGLTTITAGRIFKGQYLKQNNGEEEMLSFDEFPYTGLAKTYNTDKQVPDSAGTATALFTGVKTHYGAIGMDSTRNKTNAEQGRLTSIMDWAQAVGKRTGVVTTTRITHATPAATYAKIYHRNWECDTEVPEESVGIHLDIPRQLVESAPGNKLNVIMGGGLSPMGAFNAAEEATMRFEGSTENICKRGDNRNLAQEWLKLGGANDTRHFVQTREQLSDLDLEKTDHLMGLFRNNHITYSIARQAGEPTLQEMTEAAIKVLQRPNSKGFVLLVEGGRIDQAHHQNYARAAMHEVLEFDRAVEAALNNTDPEETLILVTADHSHAMTLNGYPARGNDILGFANANSAKDLMVYETLTYANGPGYYDHVTNGTNTTNMFWSNMKSLTQEQFNAPTYRHMATVPLKDETHGGEDVIVFAHGPGSSLVRGVFEQNYLAYVMSYAGCMGPANTFDDTCRHVNSAAGQSTVSYLLFTLLASFIALINVSFC